MAAVSAAAPATDHELLFAAQSSDLGRLRWLVEQAQCDLTATVEPETVLHAAVRSGSAEVVTFIHANMASEAWFEIVNLPDAWGRTAVHHAALRGSAELVRLLKGMGADLNVPNAERRTPLHMALARARGAQTDEVVAALLTEGGDYDAADCDGVRPTSYASVQSHPAVAAVLAERKAKAQEEEERRAREAERRRLREAQTALVTPETRALVEGALAASKAKVAGDKASGARHVHCDASVHESYAKEAFLAGFMTGPSHYVPPKVKRRKKKASKK
eukprot:c14604_g1_i1.p1 GENE.c14604_g1_i1~~c14604_g1_i1.p1  ORF type:complete len:312 (-),score=55.41 c14604_g1_i1:49-873(-)